MHLSSLNMLPVFGVRYHRKFNSGNLHFCLCAHAVLVRFAPWDTFTVMYTKFAYEGSLNYLLMIFSGVSHLGSDAVLAKFNDLE